MMTARLRLTDSYIKEGFTPFYSKELSNKFTNECLTKIEKFARVLINKGHEVDVEHRSRDGVEVIALAIDQLDTIYYFCLTNLKFEYEIHRRVK